MWDEGAWYKVECAVSIGPIERERERCNSWAGKANSLNQMEWRENGLEGYWATGWKSVSILQDWARKKREEEKGEILREGVHLSLSLFADSQLYSPRTSFHSQSLSPMIVSCRSIDPKNSSVKELKTPFNAGGEGERMKRLSHVSMETIFFLSSLFILRAFSVLETFLTLMMAWSYIFFQHHFKLRVQWKNRNYHSSISDQK